MCSFFITSENVLSCYACSLPLHTDTPFEKDGEILKVLIQPEVEYWQPLL